MGDDFCTHPILWNHEMALKKKTTLGSSNCSGWPTKPSKLHSYPASQLRSSEFGRLRRIFSASYSFHFKLLLNLYNPHWHLDLGWSCSEEQNIIKEKKSKEASKKKENSHDSPN